MSPGMRNFSNSLLRQSTTGEGSSGGRKSLSRAGSLVSLQAESDAASSRVKQLERELTLLHRRFA
ncbi:hypothetical protein KIPB_011221, partial [Kipferlia bialata]|eukprot:g11221.t1